MKGYVRCIALVALLGAPRLAYAEDTATAAAHFRAAQKAIAAKDYRTAASEFESAYRASPHPAAMVNAAQAWDSAGEAEHAADDYELALSSSTSLEPAQTKIAQGRLTELRQSLGWAALRGDSTVAVSSTRVKERNVPAVIHFKPGKHTLTVHSKERGDLDVELDIRAGHVEDVDVDAVIARAKQPDPTKRDPIIRDPIEPQPPQQAPSPTMRRAGYVLAGLGVVSGAVAIVTGVKAIGARDDFVAGGARDANLRSKADTLRTVTNVALGGAVVLAGAGVTLIVLAPSEPAKPQNSGLWISVSAKF